MFDLWVLTREKWIEEELLNINRMIEKLEAPFYFFNIII
jgi:hypothetical protein